MSLTGNCSAIIDSTSASAARVRGNAALSAAEFDLAGSSGIDAKGNGTVQGDVNTGVPAMADPLAALAAPTAPATVFSAVTAGNSAVLTLQPGEYVGGINVSGSAAVTLLPGIYYLQGGGLSVSGQASLSGQGVLQYAPAW